MIYIPIFVNIVLLLLFGYRYLFFSLVMSRRKLQLLVCILAWFRPAKCVGGRSYYLSWGGGFKNSLPRSSPADGLHGSCKNVCRGGRFLICLNGCRRPSSSALIRNALLPSRRKSTDLRALSFQNELSIKPLCLHNAPMFHSLLIHQPFVPPEQGSERTRKWQSPFSLRYQSPNIWFLLINCKCDSDFIL